MEIKQTKLSERMAMLGFTDKSLAASVRCDRSMIAKLRVGTVNPSLRLAKRLKEKTGLHIEDLITDSEQEA